jgi:hypothetical protein
MSENVKAWPKPTGRPDKLPRRIVRPCDYGLWLAVQNAEAQLGTIEAYNRLVAHAEHLRAQIDAGKAKAQNPLFAVSTGAAR